MIASSKNARLRRGGQRGATLRLGLALLVGLVVTGCADNTVETEKGGALAKSRGIAIAAKEKGADLASFCEQQHAAGAGPSFGYPELSAEAPADAPGWRWVNVWATWCKPCVEEMPLLTRWSEQLRSEGRPIQMVFVSADSDDEVITRFRQEHEGMPASHRVADTKTLPQWLQTVGMDEGAPLPVHFVIAPDGKIRCARAGSVKEEDYRNIVALLEQ